MFMTSTRAILRPFIRRAYSLWPHKRLSFAKDQSCSVFVPNAWNRQFNSSSVAISPEAASKADSTDNGPGFIDELSDTIIITKQCAEVWENGWQAQ